MFVLSYDLTMKTILLILLFWASVASADVYRSVDAEGNITFSDEPSPSAEKIHIPKPQSMPAPTTTVVTPVAIPTEPLAEPEEKAVKYSISVVSPEQDATIWDNTGNVAVSVNVEPELKADKGHSLRYQLDGKQVGNVQTGMTFSFSNVDRGSHIIVVSVVDKMGVVLKRSKSVLFHLRRHVAN